jgi:hypothetical protein
MKKTVRITALALVIVMMAALLASCGGPNADPAKAEEALKNNGYTAVKIDGALLGLSGYSYKGLNTVVTGVKSLTDPANAVVIFYFDNAESANNAWEAIQADEAPESENDTNYEIAKSGKMIYAGHKDAIKAAS